ncbi:phage minor head protein [Escherichia coli]
MDVLKDIRDGLTAALADGGTFREFAAQLEPLLEKKGWLGKRLIVDEDTGELYGRQLTPRRLRTIFDTNIQSSYNAGRYQQQMVNVADRPYFERVAVMDLHTRPKHAALNGFTARADDPGPGVFISPGRLSLPLPYPGAFGVGCGEIWPDGTEQRGATG